MENSDRFDLSGMKLVLQVGFIMLLAVMTGLGVNQVRSDPLPLIGDWSTEARLQTPSGQNMTISLDEATRLFHSGQAIFLDARSSAHYEEGHIASALCLPWQEFDIFFDQVFPNLLPGVTIITYCDGETCDLSKHLAEELYNMGYENVRVLVNGWSVWLDAGLPVEEGPGVISSADRHFQYE